MVAGKLRIVCGPTGAGKSRVAMMLAEEYEAAIVSADSRQVYCYFDIGTAKPTRDECTRVTHYGVDVAEPGERYSAARWAREAVEWIECAGELDKAAIVVGGTGLYIKALVQPLFDAPAMDPVVRSQLESQLSEKSVDELRRWCEALDPSRAHLGRTQLLRSIETALLAGGRMSELHEVHAATAVAADVQPTYLVVDPGDGLASQIEHRVDQMLDRGWIDEVKRLLTRVPTDAPAWKASGYAAIRDHVEGKTGLSTTRERIIIETRQYAKRQRTWFRHQLPADAVTKLNPLDSRAAAIAREWWERAE
ncbi:MAG: tRNA (adenosine(37)-N6)-dimethylallyltransferase MiaA [Gemmatimonadaceae bacterium]